MIIPNIWKSTSHVPNHQPEKYPIIPFQNPKQTFAKTSQQDMEPRCHSAFPLLESELLELQEDEESTDILPSDVADFFWGVQSSRTGRFNHQKIYGFMVLGCYGAIMIYHDLTWFNQQKCWFNGDLRYGCSDLTRKKKTCEISCDF